MAERCDVAIVGGGSGGYVAAIRAAQLGLKTVVIEADKVGGTCLHRGCIPTKALLQTAALVDALHDGARFGVTTAGVDIDYSRASRRRDEVVNQLHRGVEYLLKKNAVSVVSGRARLAGAHQLSVVGDGENELQAQHIILATGSRPRSLPGLDFDQERVISSDEALRLTAVPASAIVVGAGAVGVEFASLWCSLGSQVTLVEMADRLTPLEDGDIGVELRKRFEKRGITCLVGATMDIASVERNEGGVAVTVTTADGEKRLQAATMLIATGRAANVDGLGLEESAVAVERGTMVVDEMQRTGEPDVFAIGDAVGGFQLAHKAMHEGVIAAEVIAGQSPHPLNSNLVTRTTYCAPQIASVGLSEQQARQRGGEIHVGVMPLRGNARATVWGEGDGFCKVVADAAGNTLGVHIIGHEVTELIYGPALGMLLEATPFEMARAVAPHPTLSEVIGEAALAVSGDAIHI